MEKLLSRKFILTVLVLIIASITLYVDIITAQAWVELVKWLIVTYAGSNVAEHGVHTMKNRE